MDEVESKFSKWFFDLFFHVPERVNPLAFIGRSLLFLIIVIWGIKFICAPMGSYHDASTSFMHMINLPFHEAGHVIFRPFPPLMTSFGGTLAQMLVPLICLFTFLFKSKDPFGASVALWWFGENFLDIAPYIDDARSLTLPLIGGNFGYSSPYGFHDWEFILTELNMLRYDHSIAKTCLWIGAIVMILSFLWGGFVLFMQARKWLKK